MFYWIKFFQNPLFWVCFCGIFFFFFLQGGSATKQKLQMEREVSRVQSLLSNLDQQRELLMSQMQGIRKNGDGKGRKWKIKNEEAIFREGNPTQCVSLHSRWSDFRSFWSKFRWREKLEGLEKNLQKQVWIGIQMYLSIWSWNQAWGSLVQREGWPTVLTFFPRKKTLV